MSTPPRNAVGWFEIYVQDMERARAFYEKTFAVKLEALPMPEGPPIQMLAFPMSMEGGGASGALVKMEGKDSGCGGVIIYFSCEDCGQTAEIAKEAGGSVVMGKQDIGEYGFIALVIDTEGTMIGLHSQ